MMTRLPAPAGVRRGRRGGRAGRLRPAGRRRSWRRAPTLPPPTPAGMEEMPPQPPLPPDTAADELQSAPRACGRSPTKADADAAVADIRARGRLIVGLDIGSNLFSFRDPITGEITGFDVDIAGEVARDIFGTPSQVEYRILSSADRITALQNNAGRHRRQDHDHHLRAAQAGELLHRVSRRQPTHPGPARLADHQARPTCPASGCAWRRAPRRCTGSSEIAPPPIIVSVVTWADCLVALQQRQVDAVSTDDSILAGLVAQDPYLHIVGPNMARSPTASGSTWTTPAWSGSSTARWNASAATARGTRCTASG